MTNPLARLFSSLANVVLDLGLPTIRGWLRERLGPDADVTEVKTDGSLVTLEGVRIPLGPRGLIVLDRATAMITGSIGGSAPALRLHSFTGVLVFTRPELRDAFARTDQTAEYVANATFRADIAFTAGDDPEPDAWIWGDLQIPRALWSTGRDAPPGPLRGAARLFVSSREWRLEGARLDGDATTVGDGKPPAVARFAGAGVLEQAEEDAKAKPLLPIATLAFSLEHGRIGPFLDALTALAGEDVVKARVLPLREAVPRDTQLDGEISWSETDGARAELRLDAATIGARATVRAGFAPDGSALNGRVDGTVALAPLLRRLDAPALAMPREEDVVAVSADVRGHVRAISAEIAVAAASIGFRLGRPRFVPAIALRDVRGVIIVDDGKASGRITAKARNDDVTVDLDGRRVDVRATRLDAAFLRDVLSTLGRKIVLPDDTTADVALTIDGAATGRVTLATKRTSLALDVGPTMRLDGFVDAADVLTTGIWGNAAVYPVHGVVDVALAIDATRTARGLLSARGNLDLAVHQRADIPAYRTENARADVVISAAALHYENLRFRGYNAHFQGRGDVSFGPPRADAPPYLVLKLLDGGLALASALWLLVPEPRPAIAFLPALAAKGTLTLGKTLVIDLALSTPAGTQVLASYKSLGTTSATGVVALEDALYTAGSKEPVAGLVELDLDVVANNVVRAVLTSDHVAYGPLQLSAFSSLIVIANGAVLWNRADARVGGGRLSSFGVFEDDALLARLSAASISIESLPPIEGRALGKYVRGRASGSAVLHRPKGSGLEARGDVVLDEAAFPAIDKVRPQLEKYGLRPPNEDATGPAVATIALEPSGAIHIEDVAVDLHGASVRAKVDIGAARALDGKIEIVLEEEYLRTSKLLTLPRVLGERLVVPITLSGTTATPQIHAEVGKTLGKFMRESKIGEFVTSAVEEAQLFFTSNKRKTMTPPAPEAPPPAPPTWEADLRAAVDAQSEHWTALAARRR